jgi:hypothetical protein
MTSRSSRVLTGHARPSSGDRLSCSDSIIDSGSLIPVLSARFRLGGEIVSMKRMPAITSALIREAKFTGSWATLPRERCLLTAHTAAVQYSQKRTECWQTHHSSKSRGVNASLAGLIHGLAIVQQIRTCNRYCSRSNRTQPVGMLWRVIACACHTVSRTCKRFTVYTFGIP